jgi:hypothetical protein
VNAFFDAEYAFYEDEVRGVTSMLFKVNEKAGSLERANSNWDPKELELERLLVTHDDADASILSESVFGEPLLLVSNQVRTAKNKRADMLALDRSGNGVIIELKRTAGRLGIETQALQYLADFSNYRGADFLRKYSADTAAKAQETALAFFGSKTDIKDINLRSRVILVARSFDESVFSLGEWLSSKGVAFRCISYFPIEIGETRYLSFSVAFDHSPEGLYQLSFSTAAREPGIYWHNIARADQAWWAFLVKHGQIPACFEDSPGDQGEKTLAKYVAGDKVVAYAKGFGAVGWGIVDNPPKYRLLSPGDKDDFLRGMCRHRLSVSWKATAHFLSDAISADEIRKEFSIYHPISTSVSMDQIRGQQLLDKLSTKFGFSATA